MARVLIVDDEPNMRWILQDALSKAGHSVSGASSGEEALALLARTPVELVILDLKLKGMDGLATLREIHHRWPAVVVIILTAYGTVATAVEALQSGATDYLRKPFDVEELVFKLARALERQALQHEILRLRGSPSPPLPGSHPVWCGAIEAAVRAGAQGLDLWLAGEAGSGRATLARYVHAAGPLRQAPLVELDLRTLPAERQALLLEGTPERGGFWARAGQGVLLLRHDDALSAAATQVLLQLLDRRAQAGVGPLLIITGDGSAMPNLLAAEVRVPPLRAHRDDLPLLAATWLGEQSIAPGATQILHAYDWPGNIAELRGVLAYAQQQSRGTPIEEQHLPAHLRVLQLTNTPFRLPPEGINLEAVEASLIRQALILAAGNKSRAAELLGLTRHTLLYRLEKYQIGDS